MVSSYVSGRQATQYLWAEICEAQERAALLRRKKRPVELRPPAKSSAPQFKVGDRVRVSAIMLAGRTANVRRVFWANGGGGWPAGWVCVLDIPAGGSGRWETVWESLLSPA